MIFQQHLVNAILNEPWALHPDVLDSYIPFIANILNNDIAFEKGDMDIPETVAISAVSGDPSNGSSFNIHRINISGALTKSDQFCGPAGMATIGSWIQNADVNKSVDGILLVLDTPGGTVAGTETLAAIIKNTKKPIVAFVDDMCCSAGYWLASQCDEIIANNSTAQIGSIGVMMSFADVQPYYEKLGIKFHSINAPQSKKKNTTFDKLRAGDYEEYKTTVLFPLAEKFISTVKSNRPEAKDDQTDGSVFFAKDLVGTLIDSIGSIDTAYDALVRLSSVTNTQKEPNSSHNTMNNKPLTRLAKAAGVQSIESTDDSYSFTAEMAEAVESALEAAETSNADLQKKITDSTNQQSRITELEGQLQTATEEIAELKKGPGAETVKTGKETDESETASNDSFWGRFNALSETLKSK